jgi:flagellar protein FliJ
MSAYRFRLESVLRVRRLQEERARAEMALARLAEQDATARLTRCRGKLDAASGQGGPGSDAADWQRRRDRLDRLAGAVAASQWAEVHAAELHRNRLESWGRAALDVAALERLDDRHRAEHRSAEERREQQEQDEVGTRSGPMCPPGAEVGGQQR